MSDETVARKLEAVIFASDGIATIPMIRRALPRLTPAVIAKTVAEINEALEREGRPYEVTEVGGGFQFRTRPEYGDLIRASQAERKVRLSRAALETLAVIAYKQPITRAEVEELRCVDCGAVLRSLLDRDLVRIVGRRDAPGRPALYGSSANFLSVFGLPSLRDLPALRELEELLASGESPDSPDGEGEGGAGSEGDERTNADEDADEAGLRDHDAASLAPDVDTVFPAVDDAGNGEAPAALPPVEPFAGIESTDEAREAGAPAAAEEERGDGAAPEPEGEIGA